jgi:hypothetical protein
MQSEWNKYIKKITFRLFLNLFKVLVEFFTVDNVPESFYEFAPIILVINIVGMLPHIKSHDCFIYSNTC